MIVAIYACEGTYGGLHGINSQRIVEVSDRKEAEEWGEQDSRDVIDSYGSIYEDFKASAEGDGLEDGTEEFDEYIEECIQENVEYYLWEVVDCYADIETMERDFFNHKDEFVKEHCRELE